MSPEPVLDFIDELTALGSEGEEWLGKRLVISRGECKLPLWIFLRTRLAGELALLERATR